MIPASVNSLLFGGLPYNPHRYWRIISADVSWTGYGSNPYYCGMTGMSFYESGDTSGTDLCLSKTCAASSVLGAYYANNVADNSPSTIWSSTYGSNPGSEWVSVDFGAGNAFSVHSIKMYWYGYGVAYWWKKFHLQHSDDGINWTTQNSNIETTNFPNTQQSYKML